MTCAGDHLLLGAQHEALGQRASSIRSLLSIILHRHLLRSAAVCSRKSQLEHCGAGDKFGVYQSQLAAEKAGPFRPVPFAQHHAYWDREHFTWAPFSSIAAIHSEPLQLLVLQHDGRVIWELSHSNSRPWNVSLRLVEPLHSISFLGDELAAHECAGPPRTEPKTPKWGILASSRSGEAVVLCPHQGALHPRPV